MSDTPETDQFKIKFKTACGEKYWVPVEFSETLEKQRNESRESSKKWYDCCVEYNTNCKQAEKELEEAIEALLKIDEIYIDGDDTYEDRIRMGKIARAALDK